MFGITGTKNYMALKNAINAKCAYEIMPEDAKDAVDREAWLIAEGGGREIDDIHRTALSPDEIDWSSYTEFERFTMYSYALMSNDVMPALKGEQWLVGPKNPFILRVKPKEVLKATGYFKDKHKIVVTMAVA